MEVKKLKFIILFFVVMVMATGCNAETLSCTKEEDVEAGTMTETQVFSFNGGNLSEYSAEMKLELNEEYQDFVGVFSQTLEDVFEEYKEADGINYETSQEDNLIIVSISGSYKDMDEDVRSGLGISEDMALSKIKVSLEEDGYTCN